MLVLTLFLVGCGGSSTHVYVTPYTEVYVANYTGYTWDAVYLYGWNVNYETYLTLYPGHQAFIATVPSGWYDIELYDSYFGYGIYYYDVYVDGDYMVFEVW